jgi:transposase-like protein
MSVWFLVIHLAFVLEKSTRAAAKEACLSYGVCYRMVRSVMDRIYRHAMKARLRGVVEADDFYVNAGFKGRNYHGKLGRPARCRGLKPPPGRGSYSKDEPMILNLFQRDGPLKLKVMEDIEPGLKQIICQNIEKGSTIYTDDYMPYRLLSGEGYIHEIVNHSQGEYARGNVHVNHDEGIVSLFKPWLQKHRGVNKRNLPLYTATFQTLYNMRNLSNREKFWKIIRICISNNIPH